MSKFLLRVHKILFYFAAAAVGLFMLNRPDFKGDSGILVDNAFRYVECMKDGHWISCGGGGPYPLFQYIPATFLAAVGAGSSFIMHFLAYLSVAAFFGILWIFYSSFKDRVRLMAFGVLFLGYDLRYITSTFGEMLAAFLILAFVYSLYSHRKLAFQCALLFLATLTKETAWPILALIAVVTVWPDRKRALALAGTTLAGFGAGIMLNFFRYGTWKNIYYMSSSVITSDPRLVASSFAAIWFSPVGGILFFWPAFFVVILLCLTLGWKSGTRERIQQGAWVIAILAVTFGLSHWYVPMGWTCWGPRLILPWLPAFLYVLLLRNRDTLSTKMDKAIRCPLFWWIAGAVSVASIPQMMALFATGWENRVSSAGICTPHGNPNWDCLTASLWPSHSPLFDMFLPGTHPEHLALAILLVSGVFREAWTRLRYK